MSSALYLFSTFFYQVLNLHPFPFVQQYVLSFFSSLLFSFLTDSHFSLFFNFFNWFLDICCV